MIGEIEKMGTFSSIEEARTFFMNDRFAAVNGMEIDALYDGGCVCSMEIRDDHRNAVGGVMGGVIFTLADFAFAVSSNNDHNPTVALQANINYFSSSKGTRLIAKSDCVKKGKTTSVFHITVTDDLGKDIALLIATGYKLQ